MRAINRKAHMDIFPESPCDNECGPEYQAAEHNKSSLQSGLHFAAIGEPSSSDKQYLVLLLLLHRLIRLL